MSLIITQGFGLGGDVSSPTVTDVFPMPGTDITKDQAIIFDIRDDSLFSLIIVTALFSSLDLLEVVHDGTSFGPAYDLVSTRTVITGGYSYSVIRNGGWTHSPTIIPYAVDASGNENI